MNDPTEQLALFEQPGVLAAAALVACRLGGLFIAALFLRDGLLTARLRLGALATLAVCALLAEPVRSALTARHETLLLLESPRLEGWLLMASEFAVGGILGWLVLLVLGAVRGACQIISQQTGLAGAAVVDPLGSPEEEALSRLYTLLAIVVLFSMGLHHTLIRTVVESFLWLPPGSVDAAALPRLLGHLAVSAGPDLLAAAASLALPTVVAMLLVSLAQGVLGRMLPEAELLVLGLPVRVILGLAVLAVSLPPTVSFFRVLMADAAADGRELLEALRG